MREPVGSRRGRVRGCDRRAWGLIKVGGQEYLSDAGIAEPAGNHFSTCLMQHVSSVEGEKGDLRDTW